MQIVLRIFSARETSAFTKTFIDVLEGVPILINQSEIGRAHSRDIRTLTRQFAAIEYTFCC